MIINQNFITDLMLVLEGDFIVEGDFFTDLISFNDKVIIFLINLDKMWMLF